MSELKDLVLENKEAILSMGSEYAEWFKLALADRVNPSTCPADGMDEWLAYQGYIDARYSVLEAVDRQHKRSEAYFDRFFDYHRPTKEIKRVMRTLESRGYAIGYANGILIATLETTFGAVAVLIACDSWIAESIEYDRASDTWQNVQDFMFDPTRTLTNYCSSDGIPSI